MVGTVKRAERELPETFRIPRGERAAGPGLKPLPNVCQGQKKEPPCHVLKACEKTLRFILKYNGKPLQGSKQN